MYTLHASPGSSAFAPHIALEEISEPYKIEMMSNGHSETKSPEFRKLNPKGRIPVLVADGFLLTEAPAILLHLGLTYPEKGLLGSDPQSIVRAVEWTNWLSGTVHAVAVRMVWKADYFLPDTSLHGPLIESGMGHLWTAFSLIEDRMQGRDYALGSSYSVVDPYLLVFFRWETECASTCGPRIQAGLAMRNAWKSARLYNARSHKRESRFGSDAKSDIHRR